MVSSDIETAARTTVGLQCVTRAPYDPINR